VFVLKEFIRQIGFDDGHFSKLDDRTVVVGSVVRGSSLVEGFLFDHVSIDGDDATYKLADMINNSKFKDTLKVVFSKGVTIGGFNVIDIKELSELVDLPVIVILRKEPDMDKISEALKNVPNSEDKFRRMRRAGRIYEIPRVRGRVMFQKAGISKNEAVEVIKLSINTGNIPESLRISHLIGSAITLGESRRRA
jgi:endonuclease V-like protein UPF0215 family